MRLMSILVFMFCRGSCIGHLGGRGLLEIYKYFFLILTKSNNIDIGFCTEQVFYHMGKVFHHLSLFFVST